MIAVRLECEPCPLETVGDRLHGVRGRHANDDVLGESYYLRSQTPLGRFSKAYFVPLMQELISRREEINITDRTL